MDKIT